MRGKCAKYLFLLVFPLTLLTLTPFTDTAWEWYDGAWSYRRTVTVTGSTAGAQTNYQVAVDPGIYDNTGLVGSWHFSEGTGTSAFDMSGNGNNGTLTNGPVWATGRFGNASNFDGVDDYVSITDSNSLKPTTAVSVEAWIKLSALLSNYGYIYDHLSANPWYGYGLSVNTLNKFVANIYASGSSTELISNTTLAANQWYHIVYTYDNSTIKIYINGIEDASTPKTGNINYMDTVNPNYWQKSNTSRLLFSRYNRRSQNLQPRAFGI